MNRSIGIARTSFKLSLATIIAFTPSAALSSTFEALCDSGKCQISLDEKGFSGPKGYIRNGLIARWFTGGTEEFNAGKATAGGLGGATAGAIGGALLLGPIGLLGGLIGGAIAGAGAGKEVDMFFTVIGYTEDGEKTSQSFRFINKKPATKMRMELPMFTGLAIGQERTVQALKTALKDQGVVAKSSVLPTTLSVKTIKRENLPTWSSYLEERSLTKWAESNKELAEKLNQRLVKEGKISEFEIEDNSSETIDFESSINNNEINEVLPEKLGGKVSKSENLPTWSSYLEERSLTKWAESNEELAEALRIRLANEGKISELDKTK